MRDNRKSTPTCRNLPRCGRQQAHLEGGRQTLVQIADRLVHQRHVIADIAKMRSYGGASSGEVVAPQLVTDLDHWRYGMAHTEEPGTQTNGPIFSHRNIALPIECTGDNALLHLSSFDIKDISRKL